MRAVEVTSVDDAPTRERVATSILSEGPITAVELADRLRLTPAAVRRHLEQLLAEKAIAVREQRVDASRGRGRPAKVFVMTEIGRDRFDQAYDDLAASALRFLATTGGEEAVQAFARHRVEKVEDHYRSVVDGLEPAEKAKALTDALTEDGFAASVHTSQHGEQICQHHCPVAHVAEEFPQLCEAETEMFARLLGTHVQRLATIAHGDGVCTTHLPHPPSSERTTS